MSTAENSIRADLEAAVKQHAEPEVIDTTAAPVEAVETAAAAAETTASTQERARDERGRFAAKDSSGEPAGEGRAAAGVLAPSGEPAAAESSTAAVRADEGSATPPVAALAPPNGWSAEAKAEWHTLTPAVMAAVQKREAAVAKFTSTRDEHASFGKEIYQTVQPYLATIRAEGGTPVGAIQSLLNTAYVLRTGSAEQKRHLILQTARQFGVDLGTPAAKPNGQQPQNQIPLASIQAEVDRALAEREQAQEQQKHQRLQTEVQTEIEAFAADPKNTHYQEVKAHMAALLREGAAKGLQDAYDQAIWARPDTRATLQAQQRAEEEQKRVAAAKQKAQDAKRKNVSITGGPGNTAGAAAPGGRSIREELMAAVAESSGSV